MKCVGVGRRLDFPPLLADRDGFRRKRRNLRRKGGRRDTERLRIRTGESRFGQFDSCLEQALEQTLRLNWLDFFARLVEVLEVSPMIEDAASALSRIDPPLLSRNDPGILN
jgi:hypothetical protein